MINRLKQINRTVLEMDTGLLLWGVLCNIAGLAFADNKGKYSLSIWFGIVFGLISILHMYRTLNKALDYDEKGARAVITIGYLTRYAIFFLIMALTVYTGVLYPLIVFLAYIGMKVAAFLQPLVHKFYNNLFHETDPVPEALPEDEEELGGK